MFTCPIWAQQVTRALLAALLLGTWGYLIADDVLRAQGANAILTEQLQSIRERVTRNEQILFPAAENIQQILVRLAVIEESVIAGKYLAAVMTTALVGQFVLAIWTNAPPRRRRDDAEP